MVRSGVAVIWLMSALTINAAAMAAGTWTSFIGGGYPSPAEIEVVEQGRDGILVDMTLDGMNVREREEHGRRFQFLSVPQASWTNETGKPKLPVIRTLLMIPSDNDVRVQVEDGDHSVLGDRSSERFERHYPLHQFS